jgi:hypothetical protein
MPDFWMDADSFITPHRGPYRFGAVPQFWDFLKEKAEASLIGSPELVLDKELTRSSSSQQPDALETWARPLRGILFITADSVTQARYKDVAQYVQSNMQWREHNKPPFLAGGDSWLVAYALARGGRIVTFETAQPLAKKPKVPDVAQHFGVNCLSLWDMLEELGFKA